MVVQRLPWILIVCLLSGCTSQVVDEAPGPEDAAVEPFAGFEPPTWSVGDWWTYRFDDGAAVSWVVTASDGAYMLDVDDADFAFTDAALDDVSTIGAVSLELAGSQDGQEVRFFDWPLTDGKSWDLVWDGLEFTATASVTETGALVLAQSGAITRLYDYDPATQWFSYIESQSNGTTQWRVEQSASGSDYGGTYVRALVHDKAQHQFGIGADVQDVFDLDVPEDTTDLWMETKVQCTDVGSIQYAVMPPTPATPGALVSSACPVTIDQTSTMEPQAGTWNGAIDARGVAGSITVVVRTFTELSL